VFKTLEETVELIQENKLLHISGAETLLRQLPKGKWIGGTTEYFVSESGGVTSDQSLDVSELGFDAYKLAVYSAGSLPKITRDAYKNGFTVLIIPFESAAHREYARNVTGYADLFTKNIIGWISGVNLSKAGMRARTVIGYTGEFYTDKAVAIHVKLENDQTAMLNIINIFSPDETSPVITVNSRNSGFSVRSCAINGRESSLADYINDNNIDVRLPLIGDYSGVGINVSIKEIRDGEVILYAPVFEGIEYRFAEKLPDYEGAFNREMNNITDKSSIFSCNCILNYLYGELEGKRLDGLFGPVTFGEIAWQLLNQTLVYLQISGKTETPVREFEMAGVV
jgi:hypothetical protein